MSDGEPLGEARPPADSEQATADKDDGAAGRNIAPTVDPGGSLGNRAARGASVVMFGQGLRILMQIASVAVLARLLTPIDYGLVATVLVIVGVGEIFRDFGLSTAAIQAERLDRHQQESLFWLNAAIGLGLACVTFAAAPAVAAVLDQPALGPITRVLALTFLINGMTAQYRADLNRRMKFGSLVAADVIAQAVAFAVAVVWAARGGGYWSLVAQQLAQVTVALALLVTMARWVPGRPRRGADIKPMVRYGRNLVATQLVGYANNNVDTLTIAIRFGPAPLGIYTRGFQLLMSPLNQLRAPTTTVALPVLARLRNDTARAGDYIKRGQLALGYTLVAGLAFAGGTCVPLVKVALGDRWSQVAAIFGILSVGGAFQTLSYVGNWVYLSRGLTASLVRYTLISLSIKIMAVLIGSKWGIVGVAAGYSIAPGIAWPLSLWWLSRLTELPVKELWLGAMRILGCATGAGLTCLLVVQLCSGLNPLVQLTAGAATVAAVYLLAARIFRSIRSDFRAVALIAKGALQR